MNNKTVAEWAVVAQHGTPDQIVIAAFKFLAHATQFCATINRNTKEQFQVCSIEPDGNLILIPQNGQARAHSTW